MPDSFTALGAKRFAQPCVIVRGLDGSVDDFGIVAYENADPKMKLLWRISRLHVALRFLQRIYQPREQWNEHPLMIGANVLYHDPQERRDRRAVIMDVAFAASHRRGGQRTRYKSNNCVSLHLLDTGEVVRGKLYRRDGERVPDTWRWIGE
jgi:hypothetical protein